MVVVCVRVCVRKCMCVTCKLEGCELVAGAYLTNIGGHVCMPLMYQLTDDARAGRKPAQGGSLLAIYSTAHRKGNGEP